MPRIRFSSAEAPPVPVRLDASQLAVLALPAEASAAVLGAPGSGKTTVLLELLADRVAHGVSVDGTLVLASSRASATRLRDAVALRLGLATDGPRVRTVASLAFELATSAARLAGAPSPRLITGGEQDADFAELLADDGDAGEGDEVDAGPGADPSGADGWPAELGPRVRELRAFRSELREVLARVTEQGLAPADLTTAGERVGRPEWVAAGRFLGRYLDVVAQSRPDQFDAAELARFAVAAIERGTAGPRVDALRLVLVDDAQEATESTWAVLAALAGRGVPILAFGDPDVAANAFRGGDPSTLGRLGARLGVPVQTLVLDRVHRHGPEIRALVSAATDRVGAAAAGRQREAGAADRGGADGVPDPQAPVPDPRAPVPDPRADLRVERITAGSPGREAAAIARRLREAHLLRGIPWQRLAVVVRSGARVPALERSLALADVPTRVTSGGIALRDEGSARALLTLVEIATGRRALDPELADELLLGPFGGVDALATRHLRRALHAEEVTGGGDRPVGELLVEALERPGRLVTIEGRAAARAARLAETLGLLRAATGTIEDLLWLAWERSGLAPRWREQALGAGIGAAEANRRLDAIVALFATAKRFVERRPEGSPLEFLAEVLDAEVPEDILLPRSVDEAVLVTTPSGMLGVEVDTVVIAGLQQGVWPNMRPRGTLLSPQRIAGALAAVGDPRIRSDEAIADAVADARKAVLDDELRMFALAASRATERVVLTAVANDDDQPSPLVRLGGGEPAPVDDRMPLSLRGTVGHLRRLAVGGESGTVGPGIAADAAATLAVLAREGVPGADPDDWLGLLQPSTRRPLHEGASVPVSPSRVEALEESPLDWFLEEIAGGDPGVTASVGTIVHWAMETAADPSLATVWAAIESRWSELVFESPWLAERQRRLTQRLAQGLSAYLTGFAASGATLVGAERRFALDLEGPPEGDGTTGPAVQVRGSIDRVEVSPTGEVVIVDLKTGTPISATRIADHPQLGAYQLAYAEGGLDEAIAEALPGVEHRAGGAKLVFVKKGTRSTEFTDLQQGVLDAEGIAAVRARLSAAAGLIAAAEFRGLVLVEDRGPISRSSFRLHRTFDVTSDGVDPVPVPSAPPPPPDDPSSPARSAPEVPS